MTISAWESECVADCRPVARRAAATIGNLHTIGWTAEDAENELLMQVAIACRHWAAKHVGKPPMGYLVNTIKRHKYRMFEKIRKSTERGGTVDSEPLPPVKDDNPTRSPDWATRERERPVSNLLGAVLTPAEIALLKLRVDGWSNTEIAALLDIETGDNQTPADVVKKRHYYVRKKARDFLQACGIGTVEGALTAPPEVLHAAWTKAHKRRQ